MRRDLIGLLRREGHYSGVWFSDALIEAADEIERLRAENAHLREVLSFDCTAFPGMEEAAIEWANKISGPLGGKPHHPDPIGILDICEDVAKRALGADHAE